MNDSFMAPDAMKGSFMASEARDPAKSSDHSRLGQPLPSDDMNDAFMSPDAMNGSFMAPRRG